jgi:hypothetical protein
MEEDDTSTSVKRSREEESGDDDEEEGETPRSVRAEATTSGGRAPMGQPTKYVGQRPVTHGWKPDGPDPVHLSSPTNLYYFLEQKGVRTDTAYNALRKSRHPDSILDFILDPSSFDFINTQVSKTQSVHSKANVARAVTIALDHRFKWEALQSVSVPLRIRWREELNRYEIAAFKLNEVRSKEPMLMHLEEAQALVIKYYANKSEDERCGKYAVLLYAYLFCGPFRDDFTASKMVECLPDCVEKTTNYWIVPRDATQPISFYLQCSKTYGEGHSYAPRVFVVPQVITDKNEWGQMAGEGLLEFNRILRVYLTTGNRNSTINQEPSPFVYGDYLFGKTLLGKSLKEAAMRVGILQKGGFVVFIRQLWENFAKRHDIAEPNEDLHVQKKIAYMAGHSIPVAKLVYEGERS